MGWAEPFRKIGVRANADIPRDAIQAKRLAPRASAFAAPSTCSSARRIPHMRAMILADNEKDRRTALKKLLPMQRADFIGLS